MFFSGCQAEKTKLGEAEMELIITSPAFQEGEEMATQYTCDGEDISPELSWVEPPSGTQSFALIMDDPDAPVGVFTHWVIFNIPATSRGLPGAVPSQPQLPDGTLQGKNDFGRTGYGGPCPPSGKPHRYQFTIYALDRVIDLKAGAAKRQLLESMQGHILAQGRLTGTYQR
jgi:hypothetical protein